MITLKDPICFPQFAGCRLEARNTYNQPIPFRQLNGDVLAMELYGDENGVLHSQSVDGVTPTYIGINSPGGWIVVFESGSQDELRRYNLTIDS